MQITLHGGPHDGRRISIGPAIVERRVLFVPDETNEPVFEAAVMTPYATRPPISVYRGSLWADGRRTWLKWQYEGSQ